MIAADFNYYIYATVISTMTVYVHSLEMPVIEPCVTLNTASFKVLMKITLKSTMFHYALVKLNYL